MTAQRCEHVEGGIRCDQDAAVADTAAPPVELRRLCPDHYQQRVRELRAIRPRLDGTEHGYAGEECAHERTVDQLTFDGTVAEVCAECGATIEAAE